MSRDIVARPLTAEAFAPFGEVLEAAGKPDRLIKQGQCGRHHDLARIDFGDRRAGISVLDAVPGTLPFRVDMVERHPEGSPAFLPMARAPFGSSSQTTRTASPKCRGLSWPLRAKV